MADGLQAPAASARLRPMHKPPLAFAGIIPAGEDTPAEPPPEGARLPSGSITISPWTVVSKCALRRGPTKRSERPGHPQTLRFGSLLLVDHRLSSLCHFATNEPSANVYLDGETTLYTIHLTMACLKIVNTPRPHAFFRLIGGFHPLVKSPLTCPLRRDCPKSRPPPQPLDWLRRRRLQGGRAHCTGSARRGIRHPSPGSSLPGPSPAAVQRAGPHPGSCPRLPSPPAGTPGWCAGCTGSCAR